MKKHLLMMTAALLLAVSTQARIIKPVEGQVWWGYFNESDLEINEANIGTGKAMTLMAAIYIPAGHEQLSGATIDAVRVYFESGVESSLSNMKIWISKELPNKFSDADYYQSTMGTLNAGANDFKLSTPYEISGEEGIYVGYSVKSTQGYFIMGGGNDAPNTFWIGNPSESMDWTDLNGYGFGKLAFQILVENGNFSSNCATAEDFGQNMVLQGQEASIPITITNMGENAVKSISYTISTEGGSTTEEKELSMGSLAMNASKTVNIPFASDEETKKYQKTFTITKVNREDNTAKKNSATGFLITLNESQPVTPVIEEFTGTWCGWCPRGTVGMEKVHEQYGDQVVQIAAHYGDPMAIEEYQSVINAFAGGFPSSYTDRQFEADPSFSSLKSVLTKAFNRIAPVSIALNAEWDSNAKTKVVFNTTTNFAYNDDNAKYAIAFVLVEDGLKGTGSNWAQSNYYSGMSTQSAGSDMAWWCKQGSSVTGIEFNHVPVAAWSALSGVTGSIPKEVFAGAPLEYSYTGSIANNSLVQDKTKLKAVALLIDRTNGTIVNAAQSIVKEKGTAINEVEGQSSMAGDQSVYDLSGRKLSTSQKGINIIRMNNGIVKKILVK